MAQPSNVSLIKRQQDLPVVSSDVFQQIELITGQASVTFLAARENNIMAALQSADYIEQLRELFSRPEIQSRVQRLQDTPLGFRTDRDPAIINSKTGQPNKPYEYAIVREAVIEALLRGLQLVGNQFNIIAGRFYCTKEGFESLIRNQTSVTSFRPVIGVPENKGGSVVPENKGGNVTVYCTATWLQSGEPASLEVEIPIRVNSASTADQLIGKAKRKFLARCYEQMSGNSMPEGDAESVQANVSVAKPLQDKAVKSTGARQASHVVTLTKKQQEHILGAAERVLTPNGVKTFLIDIPQIFGVNELPEISAEMFTNIMQNIVNVQCKENWNAGRSAKDGTQIIEFSSDDIVTEEGQIDDAIAEELI